MKLLLIVLSVISSSCGKNLESAMEFSESFSPRNLFERSSSGSSSNGSTISEVGYLNLEEKEMLKLVNDHRKSLGLRVLKVHEEASYQAQKHSGSLLNCSCLNHNGFSARIAEVRKVDERSIPKSAENVAYASTTEKVHQGLLGSRGHRKNIEGAHFTHIGLGQEVSSSGRMYFTQIFLQINEN